MMAIDIRDERPGDHAEIGAITTAAFDGAPHSSGTEAAIVDALRRTGGLALSLVAEEAGAIIGHVAFSPVTIGGMRMQWFGLGPIAVRPGRQSAGVGRRLVETGLARLKAGGAGGCVVLGDPGYYARFGFTPDPGLFYPHAPADYFQRIVFREPVPAGEVAYHAGFEAR